LLTRKIIPSILENRQLYNVVEQMKEEQKKVIQKSQTLQDESIRVLEGLATAQSMNTLASQDTEEKLNILTTHGPEEIVNKEA
jgi:hypothetical protein